VAPTLPGSRGGRSEPQVYPIVLAIESLSYLALGSRRSARAGYRGASEAIALAQGSLAAPDLARVLYEIGYLAKFPPWQSICLAARIRDDGDDGRTRAAQPYSAHEPGPEEIGYSQPHGLFRVNFSPENDEAAVGGRRHASDQITVPAAGRTKGKKHATWTRAHL
jgi:hypothetical protein